MEPPPEYLVRDVSATVCSILLGHPTPPPGPAPTAPLESRRRDRPRQADWRGSQGIPVVPLFDTYRAVAIFGVVLFHIFLVSGVFAALGDSVAGVAVVRRCSRTPSTSSSWSAASSCSCRPPPEDGSFGIGQVLRPAARAPVSSPPTGSVWRSRCCCSWSSGPPASSESDRDRAARERAADARTAVRRRLRARVRGRPAGLDPLGRGRLLPHPAAGRSGLLTGARSSASRRRPRSSSAGTCWEPTSARSARPCTSASMQTTRAGSRPSTRASSPPGRSRSPAG